ncbi:MAG: UbiA-like polyprenyltransferase [Planctomycetota bacterium]
MSRLAHRTVTFFEMIKVSHTLFALPFALGAAFLAARGLPDWSVLGKIVLAVLCARTAAMACNRFVDRRIDAANPRTQTRALPRGDLSPMFVAGAAAAAAIGFLATAAWINPLAFQLSPLALLVVLGYSWTKRFTLWCHVVLGIALAIAPLGAWVAITDALNSTTPWLVAAIVLTWTAGFDILYACLDAEFDRAHGLRSIPARLGVQIALRVSAALHFIMTLLLYLLWWQAALGFVFLAAAFVVQLLLAYEHWLVRPSDLTRVNRAFFTVNGIVSVTLMAAMMLSVLRE